VEACIKSRSNECISFIEKSMAQRDRTSFVSELADDRILRLATIAIRETLQKGQGAIGEVALTELYRVNAAIYESEMWLPGSSYIAGDEVQRAFGHANELSRITRAIEESSVRLLEIGELEEVGLEVLYRHRENLCIRQELLGSYRVVAEHDVWAGALSSMVSGISTSAFDVYPYYKGIGLPLLPPGWKPAGGR